MSEDWIRWWEKEFFPQFQNLPQYLSTPSFSVLLGIFFISFYSSQWQSTCWTSSTSNRKRMQILKKHFQSFQKIVLKWPVIVKRIRRIPKLFISIFGIERGIAWWMQRYPSSAKQRGDSYSIHISVTLATWLFSLRLLRHGFKTHEIIGMGGHFTQCHLCWNIITKLSWVPICIRFCGQKLLDPTQCRCFCTILPRSL